MSYILDALRKADAQRQRSRLPGLHAQGPATAVADTGIRAWQSALAWAAGVTLLALVVVLAWPSSPAPAGPPVSSVPVQERGPAPASAPAPVGSIPLAVATAIQPGPPAARSEPQPVPARVPAPRSAAAIAGTSASAMAAAPVAAASAPTATATSSASNAQTGTPPAGAPKLAISGGVYSTNAAQRLLVVGGQVFNEGSEVAPGVVLEQVRPNQALLVFQGQRYTVSY
ncbi:MAG: hypothetical protein NVS2B4_11550 [Ramlibacter sp.]